MSTKLSLFPRAVALAGAFMIAALPAFAEPSAATPGINSAASDTKAATPAAGETSKKTDKNKDHAAAHKSKDHALTKTAAVQKQPTAKSPAAKKPEEPAKTDTSK